MEFPMLLTLTALALQAATPTAPAPMPLPEVYAANVTGSFSSAAQHRSDVRYDEVEARIIRIWPERTDGVWLYQEQAIITVPGVDAATARLRPYFQFVGRIVPLGSGLLRRDNFRVADGARWVGMTGDDPRLAALSPADLAPASCHNLIELVSPGHWTGRTESCANGYRGATYMRSISLATPDRYVNWDRGFTATGERVWGPEWGGYVFDRVR
jgi:hypothetical protein